MTRFWCLVLTGEREISWSLHNCAAFSSRNEKKSRFIVKKLLTLWLCPGAFIRSSQWLVVNTHIWKKFAYAGAVAWKLSTVSFVWEGILFRIVGFLLLDTKCLNWIPSFVVTGVWRWSYQSCLSASIHILVANQVTTIILGGYHPESAHGEGTFPLPATWDVPRCWDLWISTSESDYM